jgi:hypothetical protein
MSDEKTLLQFAEALTEGYEISGFARSAELSRADLMALINQAAAYLKAAALLPLEIRTGLLVIGLNAEDETTAHDIFWSNIHRLALEKAQKVGKK